MPKHDRTLRAVFARPTRANINWADIENLMRHRGARIAEAEGSRVAVELNGVRAVFLRPHPRKEAGKKQVEAVRLFLERAGIEP
jgi:hypothetical protein